MVDGNVRVAAANLGGGNPERTELSGLEFFLASQVLADCAFHHGGQLGLVTVATEKWFKLRVEIVRYGNCCAFNDGSVSPRQNVWLHWRS